MKALVGITSHGEKNDRHLESLLNEYASMPWDVDVVVFSNIPRAPDDRAEVIVGTPTGDPWSLPFAHQQVFADRRAHYDLFIYSEDDVLITTRNVEAFLDVTDVLPPDEVVGFIRYESDTSGRASYVDMHGWHHWDVWSARILGGETFARFTNQHSGCYMLTRSQLERAVESGGYLVPLHGDEDYDPLCAAATDPYRQCGMTKVLCVSRVADFRLHHLSDKYVGKLGLSEGAFEIARIALDEIASGKRVPESLIAAEPTSRTHYFGWYEEEPDAASCSRIPPETQSLLSIGSGGGETEAALAARGVECTCLPADTVTGALAESRGLRVLPARIEALQEIEEGSIDCILLRGVLDEVGDMDTLLSGCRRILSPGGVVVGSVRNSAAISDLLPRSYRSRGPLWVRSYPVLESVRSLGRIASASVRRSTASGDDARALRHRLAAAGFEYVGIDPEFRGVGPKRRRIARGAVKWILADRLQFVAVSP